MLLPSLVLLIPVILSLVGNLLYLNRLRQVANTAPRFETAPTTPVLIAGEPAEPPPATPTIAVIIPAYNEVRNIQDCVEAVFASLEGTCSATCCPPMVAQVWVVDDQSTDDTLEVITALQQAHLDRPLHILKGQPRPSGEAWVGKNWACVQAVEEAQGEFLLFLDADVRLQPGAIATALDLIQRKSLDLLTLCPAVQCGCWAEWLIQPVVMVMSAVGLDFNEVNDPHTETVFAVGQFMLFRRSTYAAIGGHRAVAGEVVEDVALARRIKQQGFRLQYMPGAEVASVQMYPTFAAIWEGWTKNWYLGFGRQLMPTLQAAALVFAIGTLPWIGIIAIALKTAVIGLNWVDYLTLGLALATILLHYRLRQQVERVSGIPPRYWWLTVVGSVLVVAIALASIVKTETGWGWTWRGRSLKSQ